MPTHEPAIPGLLRTILYRTLDPLVELSVIRRLHHPGAGARFDGKIHRHHHLICRKCFGAIDIATNAFYGLRVPSGEWHGFEVEEFQVRRK